MNRYAFNNNAMAAAATMPAPIANRLVNVSRESLLDILLRPFRRGQISRELRLLDPRMLSDIGVSPSEIDRIAAESVGGKGEWIVLSLLRLAGRKIADWANKRATYRSLMSLDERMLSDIGLTRGDIPALIDAMRGPLARPVSGLESEVILPLKQWNLWRVAHKQLNQLDNRMLSDIGFVRGDIDRVADELAARTVTTAANANANSAAPRAA
ncbi:MAG TPA: DUF1127 domain-containing protein [Dongiaceae bacterium]|jgi:uncharacterized protein YjiS (DUF1127 family)|nr:DUF1127 domain-containing protein [Dongiaceae bacterium]